MKTKIIVSFIVLVVIVLGVGFYFYQPKTNPSSQVQSEAGINALKSDLAKQKELKKFSSPQEVKDFFANRSTTVSGGVVNQSFGVRTDMATKESAAPVATGLGSGPATDNFSTTNIQVAGVDESDTVKTDGNFIYSVNNNVVSIVKAVPPADASLIATIKLDGQGQELFISGDKLVVFGYDQTVYNSPEQMFIRQNSYTFLVVYDITDKTKPTVLKTFKFEGSYTASRLIDKRLYFISTTYNFYPMGDFILPKVLEAGQVISSETNSDKYNYPNVYYINTDSSYNASTVSLISLDDLGKPLTSQVYFMPAGESIYASAGNLYLTYTKYLSEYQLRMSVVKDFMFAKMSAADQARINSISAIDSTILSDDEKAVKIQQVIDNYFAHLSDTEREPLIKQLDDEFQQKYQSVYSELEKTVIHKISLNNGSLTYKGSAEVSGRVLNQYSMDEYKGYFRLATTRSQSWIMPLAASFRKIMPPSGPSEESYNNIYTLDDNLSVVSTIDKLAVGEKIYSVRFVGDRGYVVTFKQTDPLFVLDFKDPANPVIAGQLKIPGFSSYLHPYKDNMLIGIGKEAIDNGTNGVNVQGIKLSLFDIVDPKNPKEVSSLTLGGRGSDTSVLYDYKAFLYIPDKELVVIPMSLTKAGSENYTQEFQGLGIFKIETNKLVEVGRVSYSATEMITRGLYIGDYLYGFSPSMIGITQLSDLKNVKNITLSNPSVPIGGTPIPMPYEKTLK